MSDDDSTTFTRWLVIGAVVVIVAVSVVAYFSHWHWLGNLWFNYAWSSDKGNGPEAIQQTIVYALLAVLIIPPVRKWFLAKFHRIHQKIDQGHAEIKEHLERNAALSRHIIKHHPDVSNTDHTGADILDPNWKPPTEREPVAAPVKKPAPPKPARTRKKATP
jgi:uncharacterized membrane protein